MQQLGCDDRFACRWSCHRLWGCRIFAQAIGLASLTISARSRTVFDGCGNTDREAATMSATQHDSPKTPAASQAAVEYRPTAEEGVLIDLSRRWMQTAMKRPRDEVVLGELREIMAPDFQLLIWDARRAPMPLASDRVPRRPGLRGHRRHQRHRARRGCAGACDARSARRGVARAWCRAAPAV